MKNTILLLFCVVSVFFQLSISGVFFSERRLPDVILALVISLVLTLGLEKSIKWIFLAGVLTDAGSSTIFGTLTLAYFLIGWMTSWVADVADMRSKKTFFLVFFALLTAASGIIVNLFVFTNLKMRAYFLEEPFDVSYQVFSLDSFFKIFYTIVAAYAVYFLLRKFRRMIFPETAKLSKKVY